MHTHFAYHTNLCARLFATVQGNTAAPIRFIVFARENLTRNIITTQHTHTHTKWIWYVVSMSRVIFAEPTVRGSERNVANRWASIVSDDATKTRRRATCRHFYLRLESNSIYSFFPSPRFSSTIYLWAEQTCFSFTHSRQIVNLFLYNHRKNCSSYAANAVLCHII